MDGKHTKCRALTPDSGVSLVSSCVVRFREQKHLVKVSEKCSIYKFVGLLVTVNLFPYKPETMTIS